MKTFKEFIAELSTDVLKRYRNANYQDQDRIKDKKAIAWMNHRRADDPREKFAHRVEWENARKKLSKRVKGDDMAVDKLIRRQHNEETEHDMLGLHGKVVPINTDHFEGHAHISFDRIKRGRHQTHSYRVDYKGKGGHPKHGGKTEPHEHMSFMDVEHDNGRPYKFKDHPHSSKDLHTLLHKAAPRWVSLDDLKRASSGIKEDVEHPLNDKIRGALRSPFERHTGEEVKGATLGDIKDHLEMHHGIKMGTRRIEDHIYDHMRNELKHEQGHSRSGWSRGGLNKRTPARFYHKGEKYEWSDDAKKHIKTSSTYIRNKKKD